MKSRRDEFTHYCSELLSTVGPCVLRRMFGGYGISTDGLSRNDEVVQHHNKPGLSALANGQLAPSMNPF